MTSKHATGDKGMEEFKTTLRMKTDSHFYLNDCITLTMILKFSHMASFLYWFGETINISYP